MVTQAVIHLSVLSATIPRTNHFFSSLQAGVVTMRLTDFELDDSRGASAISRPRGETPPLKLVPSGTESRIQTSVSARLSNKKRKKGKGKKSADDWRNHMSMGSTQDGENSTSSLYNQHAIAMTQTQETKVEYVKKQPILLRRP
jgi:hypothetical protein